MTKLWGWLVAAGLAIAGLVALIFGRREPAGPNTLELVQDRYRRAREQAAERLEQAEEDARGEIAAVDAAAEERVQHAMADGDLVDYLLDRDPRPGD